MDGFPGIFQGVGVSVLKSFVHSAKSTEEEILLASLMSEGRSNTTYGLFFYVPELPTGIFHSQSSQIWHISELDSVCNEKKNIA